MMSPIISRSQLKLLLGLVAAFPMVAPMATMAATPGRAEQPAAASRGVSQAGSQPVLTFAAYGDIPYMITLPNGRTDDQVLKEEIAPALRQREDIPFVIHLGDLSRPEYSCTDEWLRKTDAFWKQEIIKPVFYTPGDNDWADCDRKSLAERHSELQRLRRLREILFASPKTVSPAWKLQEVQKVITANPSPTQSESALKEIARILAIGPRQFAKEWHYETQPNFPENAIWRRNGVLFVTIHMISTNNGFTEILMDRPKTAIALAKRRDRLNQRWLERAYALTQQQDIKALVVATQLDPFGPLNKQESRLEHCLSNPAYATFCRQIQALSQALPKPVLLLHGDTDAYCLDQPFDRATNLWRLNAAGDYKQIDANVIKVVPSDSSQPFQVTGLLSGQAPPAVCRYG